MNTSNPDNDLTAAFMHVLARVQCATDLLSALIPMVDSDVARIITDINAMLNAKKDIVPLNKHIQYYCELVLAAADGNITEAARLLHTNKSTLYNNLGRSRRKSNRCPRNQEPPT